jgi:methyltransferase-like protein
MTNSEYRIDLNTQNNIEDTQTVGEEIINQVQPTTTTRPTTNNDINSDHLHQLIQLFRDNLTSTFPFALILILKAFYEHSAGKYFFTNLKLF